MTPDTHNTPGSIFLHPFNTIYESAPFQDIHFDDYEPAMLEGIRQEDEEINRIANNPAKPDFKNTIEAIEHTGQLLNRVSTVFYNLLSAETNDEMDALAQKMAPIMAEHANNITLNEKLFARIKAVYDEAPDLNKEEKMLLEKTYEGFIRSGAGLDKKQKEQLRTLTKEATALTLQFSQNNLKETNNFTLHITDAKDLKGLPETQIEQASLTAKEKGLEGWVFTLQAPSYSPFLTYADNRDLRRQLYMAYNTKCTHDNEYNNYAIVSRLVNIRREMAQLLGYRTYADYVLKRRMAENCSNVYNLLNQLINAYKKPAQEEIKAIEETARKAEGKEFKLEPWDFAYYSHKLQLERYNLDTEMLRPYFELSKVKKGIFGLAQRLYGITFKENPDIQVYHPDVTAYEIYDKDGRFLAIMYTDFHPREGKQGGAWMTSYKDQWIDSDGNNHRPHVALVMNFTKPTETKPALLTLGEVETFLHEFGHALHGIFADTRFQSLSGTNVYWDFVELPSQFMENYATEKEFLQTFAYHYKTNEPIPDELIDRIKASKNFNVAYACMRQVSFALLDMAYYTQEQPFNTSVKEFEKKAWEQAILTEQQPETCMSVQFGHIMSGGYAAGYYSYKWAEVLEADAFSKFKAEGIFNQHTAQQFRNCILSKGGTEHPMTLYKRFRGQKPTIEALLRRNGILPSTPQQSQQ